MPYLMKKATGGRLVPKRPTRGSRATGSARKAQALATPRRQSGLATARTRSKGRVRQ